MGRVHHRLPDRAGVEPWICLYHGDLPQALQQAGGWASRDTVARFAEYAEIVAGRLADRVRHWTLLDEPNVHALLGHLLGVHAPGLTDPLAYAAAAHHQNLATGLAIARLRSAHPATRLGTILNVQPFEPAGDRDEDRAAAQPLDAVWNGKYLEPLARGRYPDATRALLDSFEWAESYASIVREGGVSA